MPTRESAVNPPAALKIRARGVLYGLFAQLLVGMAVNLIGPDQTAGAAKIAGVVFLILHVLIAVVLLVGSILTVVNARRTETELAGLGWMGLVVIIVTFGAGVLTMITNSGWLSYLMAAGATAALVIYGILFVRAGQSRTQEALG